MNGCPIAFSDICHNCVYYGECPPSITVEKLEKIQVQLNELKQMLKNISLKEKATGN